MSVNQMCEQGVKYQETLVLYSNWAARKGYISCIGVQCATSFVDGSARAVPFSTGPKTKLLEDIEFLLPVKFRQIPLNGFREVENSSANRPQIYNFGRGRRVLTSYHVSVNSVKRFLRSRKCLRKSEARAVVVFFFFFRSARKHKFRRGRRDIASCQVLLHSVQRLQRSRNVLANRSARKHKLGRGNRVHASCKVSSNSV